MSSRSRKKSSGGEDIGTELSDTGDLLKDVNLLKEGVLESRTNANGILELLQILDKSQSNEVILATISALKDVFEWELKGLALPVPSGNVESVSMYRVWIRSRFHDFLSYLRKLLGFASSEVQVEVVNTFFILLRADSVTHSGFDHDLFRTFLVSLLMNRNVLQNARREFCLKFLPFCDIRRFTLRDLSILSTLAGSTDSETEGKESESIDESLESTLKELVPVLDEISERVSSSELARALFTVLNHCLKVRDSQEVFYEPEKSEGGKRKRKEAMVDEKKELSAAWGAFLTLSLPPDVHKAVLRALNPTLPFLSSPVRTVNFLSSSFSEGGLIGMLAAESLFSLMTKHNLEYPRFYDQLYALCDERMLHLKHRGRFLILADRYLSSTHLPAYLVAAFVKRIARLCLIAPPAAILSAIPFIRNCFTRHESLMILVDHPIPQGFTFRQHTSKAEDSTSSAGPSELSSGVETYVYESPLLAEAHALESSLWEVETLRSHWHPAVSRLTKLFERKDGLRTADPMNLEDLTGQTMSSLFDTDVRRKGAVALSHVRRENVFWESDDLSKQWIDGIKSPLFLDPSSEKSSLREPVRKRSKKQSGNEAAEPVDGLETRELRRSTRSRKAAKSNKQ